MEAFSLDFFRSVSREMDYERVVGSLLEEFRLGGYSDRTRIPEETAILAHLGPSIRAWDTVFPDFPRFSEKRRSLFRVFKRERKDAYIRRLVVDALASRTPTNRVIVNPATVEGRQAGFLARELPHFEVIGTDIDSRWEKFYRVVCRQRQKNFRFVQESIFDADIERRPAAVVFFGACGSVADGAIDYGVAVESPAMIFRTCCHENICGNDAIIRRWSMLNRYFAMKNWQFSRYKKRNDGFYFDAGYGKEAYPRSRAVREMADSETFLQIAQNAVDSDLCISIIDLDRAIYLREQGYDVLYREEVFFAHRPDDAANEKDPAAT
jgi:hypothetical protein